MKQLHRLRAFVKEKSGRAAGGGEELRFARIEIAEKDRRIRSLRRLKDRTREVEELRSNSGEGGAVGVRPESIAWIFCTGRSGSTWPAQVMADLPGNALWDEPLVGALFGNFYIDRGAEKRGGQVHHGTSSQGRVPEVDPAHGA